MSDPKEWTTIRVPQGAADEARDAKRNSETWGDYLRRCADSDPEVREFVDVQEVLEDRPNRSAADVLNRLDDLETHLDGRLDEVLRG
ncbi:hypothetical protein OSG_eHP34_00245 [environmental Halophage eHP-34]|nr:hypothetical protein OSG_eHP34_00245 [environmental Halophage eHP-34]